MFKTRIRLNEINHENRKYQIRDTEDTKDAKRRQYENSRDHIKSLASALRCGERFPLIQVVKEGSGYLIVDGFHRVAAYRQINAESRREVGGKGKYYQLNVEVLEASEASQRYLTVNSEHMGLPLTSHQRREQRWQTFLRLETAGDRTNQTLADALGVCTRTVQKWRRQWIAIAELDCMEGLNLDRVTGFPTFEECKKYLLLHKPDSAAEPEPEDMTKCLTESDKELLEAIVKASERADEPDKLRRYVEYYWGVRVSEIPFDEPLEDADPFDDESYDF